MREQIQIWVNKFAKRGAKPDLILRVLRGVP